MSAVKFYKGNSDTIFKCTQDFAHFGLYEFKPGSFILTEDTGELYYYSDDYLLTAVSTFNKNRDISTNDGSITLKNWDSDSEYFIVSEVLEQLPVGTRPVSENGQYVLIDISTYQASQPFQFSAAPSSEYPGSTMYTGSASFVTDGRDDYLDITIEDPNDGYYWKKAQSLEHVYGSGGTYILCQVVPKKLPNPEWKEL